MAEGSKALDQCFRKFVNHEYNQEADDKLKLEGQRILDKYSPRNNKVSKINTSNIFWMISSIAVFYYTDFYLALKVDPNINRSYLNPGLIMVGISVCIATYVILYYHYYHGIKDYEKHVPYAVPFATISFIAGMICMCIGLWPVWSVLTPLILFTLFMGFIIFLTFIPL